MSDFQKLVFLLVRYCGDPTKRESINVGVVGLSADDNGTTFAQAHFTNNWRRLQCFDPLVDLEEVQAMCREIQQDLQDTRKRPELLKRAGDGYSNNVRVDLLRGCLTHSAVQEMQTLSRLYLKTPTPAEKREVSGREQILNAVTNGLEQAGLLGHMLRDFAVAEFTRAGDPFKFDFACPLVGNRYRFLQAVSLARRVEPAMMLAARFPQIAANMQGKSGIKTWLTAVVEDDLPKREEVNFALELMRENGIVVVPTAEMPQVAAGIRAELHIE